MLTKTQPASIEYLTKDQDVVIMDFETYFAVKYSLRTPGISMTDYIRHKKFGFTGMSFQVIPRGASRPTETAKFVEPPDIPSVIRDSFDWGNTCFVAHNVAFDGFILYDKFGIKPKQLLCTKAMTELLYRGFPNSALEHTVEALLPKSMGEKGKELSNLKGKYWDEMTAGEHNEMSKYCRTDTNLTTELLLTLLPYLPINEIRLIDLTYKLFCDPVLELDKDKLEQELSEAETERRETIQKTGLEGEVLRSNKFLDHLKNTGVEIPMKQNPKGEYIPALAKTDPGMQAIIEGDNEAASNLCKARLAVRSTQRITRAERMLKFTRPIKHGGYFQFKVAPFPVLLNHGRAGTQRWSGGNNTNAQNFKRGSLLRQAILAPPGYYLGVGDSSQIEVRCEAVLAGESYLVELFKMGGDPYNSMAETIYERPVDRKNVPEDFVPGFIGKTAVLGLGFKMSRPETFQSQVLAQSKNMGIEVDFTQTQARDVINKYRIKNKQIVKFWEECEKILKAMHRATCGEDVAPFRAGQDHLTVIPNENRVFCYNGMSIYFPHLKWRRIFDPKTKQWRDGYCFYQQKPNGEKYLTFTYDGKMCENIVQWFARQIIADQILNINERYRVVMTTHDEVVCLIPEEDPDTHMEWILEQLRTPPPWCPELPLDAEGGYDRCYSK